jgi:hypothetical protein
VVVCAVPPNLTTLLETNPEPLTVRVSAFEPAVTLVGLIDVTAGVDVVVPPPVPEPPEPPDPEPLDPEPPPPQPLIRIAIPKPNEKLTRRNERDEDLSPEPTFTIRTAF